MTAFLSAEWRNLVILNYSLDPELLRPYLPAGTEIDLFQGKALLSLVGFQFLNSKILGIRAPWHGRFEQVNLRFYVRRDTPHGVRTGVVFIKEICPHRLVSLTAGLLFGEHFSTLPTRASISDSACEYEWFRNGKWSSLAIQTIGSFEALQSGTQSHFLIDRYWGYTKCNEKITQEFQIEHMPWRIKKGVQGACDVGDLYPESLLNVLGGKIDSMYLIDGSPVTLHYCKKLSI